MNEPTRNPGRSIMKLGHAQSQKARDCLKNRV